MSDTLFDDATVDAPNPVAIGSCFAERYVVEELLGSGGMGVVYRVMDRVLGEQVALKLVDSDSLNPRMLDRFRREVRLARRVSHRNVAKTYDLGEHEGQRFLTMELVLGQSLHVFTNRRERLNLAWSIDVVTQIAHGLEAAHAADVLHRDLKPSNVLVEPDGRAVITDFGIARMIETTEATLQTMGWQGTPAYMAPEQFEGKGIGPHTDIYALGLILHELVAGRRPFECRGLTPMQVAIARIQHPAPRLDPRAEGVPEELCALLERCLDRDPALRPASAAELALQLGQVEVEQSVAGPGRAYTSEDSSPRTSETLTTTPLTPFAGLSGPSLAVLPFSLRGSGEYAYIADALGEELTDLLSMNSGLKVSSSGATARFAGIRDRNPQAIGEELGVDVLVDGTIQIVGARLRITARLLDVTQGFQHWQERFEGSIGDIFELQDQLAKRIAEALRLELEHVSYCTTASPEAITAYLHARQAARAWMWKQAHEHYECCLALAPQFKLALAGRAMASLKSWFLPAEPNDPDWAALAAIAVEAAGSEAAELPETQLALAIMALQTRRYHDAALALRETLGIAPTYAGAHKQLGQLELEAGRADKGIQRLELARLLEPSFAFAFSAMARYHGLRRDLARFDEFLRRFFALDERPSDYPSIILQARVGIWMHSPTRIADATQRLRETPSRGAPFMQLVETFSGPQLEEANLAQVLEELLGKLPNPRLRTVAMKIGVEVAVFHGLDRFAIDLLIELTTGPLIDLDWFERCPGLDRLRDHPQFSQCLEQVRGRAKQIWIV